jgi:hypothetical protein
MRSSGGGSPPSDGIVNDGHLPVRRGQLRDARHGRTIKRYRGRVAVVNRFSCGASRWFYSLSSACVNLPNVGGFGYPRNHP